MKVALVYDRVNKFGGAEKVLIALHTLFPKAPLYTSVYSRKNADWAKIFKVRSSFLQRFTFTHTIHEKLAPFMPFVFESFDFSAYDLVISVTSESAKGIVTHPPTRHLCICLTPTRYLWSGYKEYFSNTLYRALSYPVVMYLRHWDIQAASRPDIIVGISTAVQKRIQKYYKRSSELIFPPVEFNTRIKKPKEVKKEPFFLVVSRLVRYKRIDIAIRAANKLGKTLIVIGAGHEEENLKKIAGPTVTFLGFVNDEELAWYYKNCEALLFPGREDFGIVMVEVQLFGKPVIAYRGGGALDIVKEGETGEFFDKQNAPALIDMLKSFKPYRYNKKNCVKNAHNFSHKVFNAKMKEIVDDIMKTHA